MTVELMAPAGSLEAAKLAISSGADSVYAGVTNLSMRPKRVEFGQDSFEDLLAYAHGQGKKIYAALNICIKDQDERTFRRQIDDIYNQGADAVILSDIAAIDYTHRNYPDLQIHVSIMVSLTNPEAARFYKDLGASVIVISRSLNDIQATRQIVASVPDVDFEIFVHGGICYMFDGKCYMSSYWQQDWDFDPDLGAPRLFGQNNTKGECHLICKRFCSLETEEKTHDKGQLMRRPDQVGLADLPAYIEMGIKIFKIEGRAMPLYYVPAATQLYREAIDTYLQAPDKYRMKEEWQPQVEKLVKARHEYESAWHIG